MHDDRSQETRESPDDELSATIADRFEQEWRLGAVPEIGAYLPDADCADRSTILAALIAIDVTYRRRAGQDVRIEEYARRYPELTLPLPGGSWLDVEQPPVPDVDEETRSYPSATRFEGVHPADADAGSEPIEGFDDSGRYSLVSMHAWGGTGQVWKARDHDLGRDVAVKLLRPEAAGSANARGRFLREARITGLLQHPGIVPVYELRRSDTGRAFYAMRFISGRTLSQAARAVHASVKPGRAAALDLRELLRAFVSACQTVAYAHSRGVIHRDLKGQNVVLGDYGEVMVVDWGLAKVLGEPEPVPLPGALISQPAAETPDEEDELTRTIEGDILGTPGSMAPEQALGQVDRIEPRTDVYGLGAILYEILVGEPPYRGKLNDVLRRVVGEPPEPPRHRVAGTPAALEAVCLKCLAKDPADRYGSAGELADDVLRYLADEPVTAFAEPWTTRFRRWADRHRTVAAASAAALLVATVSLAIATVFLGRANERESHARDQAERNLRLRARRSTATSTGSATIAVSRITAWSGCARSCSWRRGRSTSGSPTSRAASRGSTPTAPGRTSGSPGSPRSSASTARPRCSRKRRDRCSRAWCAAGPPRPSIARGSPARWISSAPHTEGPWSCPKRGGPSRPRSRPGTGWCASSPGSPVSASAWPRPSTAWGGCSASGPARRPTARRRSNAASASAASWSGRTPAWPSTATSNPRPC